MIVLPRRRRRLAIVAVAIALLAAACSPEPVSDDADATTAAPGPTRTGATETTPVPDGPTATPTPTPTPSASATATPTAGPVAGAADLPPIPPAIRGIYSHVYSFWGNKWANLVDLVATTEVNAVVVDVKDEAGTLLWDIDHPLAQAGGGSDWLDDFSGVTDRLAQLKEAGGWAIARIACFKDTLVADARPDLAVQDAAGATWKAHKDFSWLNPYQDEAGQWCIDVGVAAIEMGFDEVQFDYIRFPNGGDGDISAIELPGVPDDRPREDWRHSDEVVEFLATASQQIHDVGGYVSADLFGLVTYDFRWDAGGTGQVLERIAEHVDFISPMVYPSHYSAGNYGLLPHPIEHPYETVWNSMQEARMRTQGLHAQIRPWLEDFPAPWLGYDSIDTAHVTEQMRATYENGIDGWLLWNAANSYTESAIANGQTESKANPDFRPPARTANPGAPPGVAEEREWPGMPSCDPYPGVLTIGQENLAGSIPPELALPADDPALCAGVPDGEEASARPGERTDTQASTDDTAATDQG